MFALYTGTETAEEKEITRVFNDDWNVVPQKLKLNYLKYMKIIFLTVNQDF